MHELGITQGIIDHAREAALARGAARVTDLFPRHDARGNFSQDSIEMYFEMLTGDDAFFRGGGSFRPPADRGRRCMEMQRGVQHSRTAQTMESAAPGTRLDSLMVYFLVLEIIKMRPIAVAAFPWLL